LERRIKFKNVTCLKTSGSCSLRMPLTRKGLVPVGMLWNGWLSQSSFTSEAFYLFLEIPELGLRLQYTKL
jgi:hypothetical protein